MKIAAGWDHRGWMFRDRLERAVRLLGHEFVAMGATTADSSDYPDFAFRVAEAVSRRAHRTLRPGAYAHIADSFHIYGSYFREFEGFLNSVRKRSFAERTWDSTSDFVQSAFESARAQIAQEKARERAKT